jgi:hypothetical protein
VSDPEDVQVPKAAMPPPGLEATSALGSVPEPSSTNPEDGLSAFDAEFKPGLTERARIHANLRPSIIGVSIAAAGLVAGATGAVVIQKLFGAAPRSASLTIETVPSGLEVSIDGANRGRTPLTLTLPPRAYEAVVGSGSNRRVVKATLAAGAEMVQRLELPAAPGPQDLAHGTLRVETDPVALTVIVDGITLGVSPLTVQNLAPGPHDLTVANGREAVHKAVTLRAGETVSVLLANGGGASPSAVSAGWITVSAPVVLQIREESKLLGTTESDRMLIAAGNHTLDFVNSDLGFSQRQRVNITPGKVSVLRVTVPNGTLSLNAQPWAEVWVDGTRVGETPIGNLVRPIGRHEVLFRHPELGERRETVVVTTLQPARLGVDLRRKPQ